jgi:hypothetical protein
MAINKNLTKEMSSISALQGTCNNLEKKLFAKLTDLAVGKDTSGEEVTEATFEEFEGNANKLGQLNMKNSSEGPGNAFNGTAFIVEKATEISVSR